MTVSLYSGLKYQLARDEWIYMQCGNGTAYAVASLLLLIEVPVSILEDGDGKRRWDWIVELDDAPPKIGMDFVEAVGMLFNWLTSGDNTALAKAYGEDTLPTWFTMHDMASIGADLSVVCTEIGFQFMKAILEVGWRTNVVMSMPVLIKMALERMYGGMMWEDICAAHRGAYQPYRRTKALDGRV